MARTIRTKIYKFAELNSEAQQVAINNIRNSDVISSEHIYNDAYETVKKFNDIFNLKEGRNSWLDFNTNHIDDNILELKGLRLQKYILNNFSTSIYKGKYFYLWSKTEKSFQYHKEGKATLKSRYSKVIFNNDCALTGMCYDMDLLHPIYEFLEKYKAKENYYLNMTFEQLLKNCFKSLDKSLKNEDEYLYSEEYINEYIDSNEVEFLINGKQYN